MSVTYLIHLQLMKQLAIALLCLLLVLSSVQRITAQGPQEPQIVIQPESVTVLRGEKARFVCQIRGERRGWYINDTNLNNLPADKRNDMTVIFHHGLWILTIVGQLEYNGSSIHCRVGLPRGNPNGLGGGHSGPNQGGWSARHGYTGPAYGDYSRQMAGSNVVKSKTAMLFIYTPERDSDTDTNQTGDESADTTNTEPCPTVTTSSSEKLEGSLNLMVTLLSTTMIFLHYTIT